MATHSCSSASNNSCIFCKGDHAASNTSLQFVPVVFVWASVWGHGRPGENKDDVGEELCGVECCMGSDTVVLKYSAIQRLMHETKQKKAFLF